MLFLRVFFFAQKGTMYCIVCMYIDTSTCMICRKESARPIAPAQPDCVSQHPPPPRRNKRSYKTIKIHTALGILS